jgi:hypothetical protein
MPGIDEFLLVPFPKEVKLIPGTLAVGPNPDPRIRVDPNLPFAGPEAYSLSIAPDGILIEAPDPRGAFYGKCTLAQLVNQFGHVLPCLHINDWPDFSNRGVMLDISRDKVPTMETLYRLVDLLASWKINQFQLYMEHTFAYSRHEAVWRNAAPMTPDEIRALDRYCQERFVDLVPNQNSFGHMERWLKHPEYLKYAECPDGFDAPWGIHSEPLSISPAVPECMDFIAGLYDELLPNFSSRFFNVGCDETYELGLGRSASLCKEKGTGPVYLDFIKQLHSHVRSHDRAMMFWGDIIFHWPELIGELPSDAIVLEWGYEANHPFLEHGAILSETGLQFYVCPGASNWCSLSGRTSNMFENIRNAARNGMHNGASGLLNTSWGDYGHWDPMPVAWLGFLTGAAFSWNTYDFATSDIMAKRLSLHAFGDSTGTLGRLFHDLGNLYECFRPVSNGTVPFQMLFRPRDREIPGLDVDSIERFEKRLEEIVATIPDARPTATDAGTIMKEVHYIESMLAAAAAAGRIRLGEPGSIDLTSLKSEHDRVWLLRNRPGGCEDSRERIGK